MLWYHPAVAAPMIRVSASTSSAQAAATGSTRTGYRSIAFRVAVALTLLAAAALKLSLLMRAVGFEQGDPLEYINIAHTIAHQTGEEWWDIRPILYPLTLVPLIWLGDQLPDPTGEAAVRALRMAPLLFSLGAIAVIGAIAALISGKVAAVAAMLILASNPVFNQLSISTFAEIPATFGVLLATLLALRPNPSLRNGFGTGVALGLACMVRYQSLAFIVPFGLWMLVFRRGRPLMGFSLGLIVCVVLQAALDLAVYGAPFHSLIQSATYNVTTDEAASFYGSEPFGWYVQTVESWFGWTPLALTILGSFAGVLHGRRAPWALVISLAVTMVLWLSALSHKEARFTTQLLPFLALAAGHGAWTLTRLRPTLGPALAIGVVCLAALPGLQQSAALNLTFNPGYVEGAKRVAAERPGAVLGTIPWFVARPYTHGKIELVRADVDRWSNREYMRDVVERADYILLPEYDFASDRVIQRLVDGQFRTIETYDNQVVLLQNRRLAEPERRRR